MQVIAENETLFGQRLTLGRNCVNEWGVVDMDGVTTDGAAGNTGLTEQEMEQRLEEEFFRFFMESEMIDDIFEDIES